MRFPLTAEQRAFARSLDALLTAADTPSVIRAWGAGDRRAGRALWSEIAGAGVFALAVPEAYEGVGPLPPDLAVACVELGRHAVPGPLAETVLAAVLLAGHPERAARLLPPLVAGKTMVTVGGAYAVDGDAADVVLSLGDGRVRLAPGCRPEVRPSLDPARRLAVPLPGGEVLCPAVPSGALDWARLATAAQALGVGLALLDRTVSYAGQRVQFGVPVGSFQAVKHRLADTAVALEFAEPLVFGAALSMAPADIAAAKVAACEAAYGAARTALQVHGAIGYTAEYDLSLWLTRARALRGAWGTPAQCRAAVLAGREQDL
ncbi:acyl-CoA dehydrogenase family protein [Streptomyces sp. NPDC096198]|uniref:acyl-CoA dehydrogenase family protein n=1 Tax=Streptomyces sp. NPDC096198 TaxID=3366080 RepID=UPI003817B3AB